MCSIYFKHINNSKDFTLSEALFFPLFSTCRVKPRNVNGVWYFTAAVQSNPHFQHPAFLPNMRVNGNIIWWACFLTGVDLPFITVVEESVSSYIHIYFLHSSKGLFFCVWNYKIFFTVYLKQHYHLIFCIISAVHLYLTLYCESLFNDWALIIVLLLEYIFFSLWNGYILIDLLLFHWYCLILNVICEYMIISFHTYILHIWISRVFKAYISRSTVSIF